MLQCWQICRLLAVCHSRTFLRGSRQKMMHKLLTCVHALVVVHRVLVAHSLDVKGARQPHVNVCR